MLIPIISIIIIILIQTPPAIQRIIVLHFYLLVHIVILLHGPINLTSSFRNHFLQSGLTGDLAAGTRRALPGVRLDLDELHHFAVLGHFGSDITNLSPKGVEVLVKHIHVIFIVDSRHRFG